MVIPVELSENHLGGETLMRIYEKSFLKNLAGTIELPFDAYRNPDKNKKMIERYGRQLLLLQQTIPESWEAADKILTDLLPNHLFNNNNKDIAHGLQHLNRVWQNFCVGIVNNLFLFGLNENDQRDFVMAGGAAVVAHDLLQINGKTKHGHDYLGAIFSSGLMKLAQLTGIPFSDGQLPLAARAVYHHSYPEGIGEAGEIPDFRKIMIDFKNKYNIDPETQFPVLAWLKEKLAEQGVELYALDQSFSKVDKFMARILCQELGAADKRDSMAPASMANLRTMMVNVKRPFADFTQGVERHKNLIEVGIDGGPTKPENFPDDISRILYELVRDPRISGMSPFEIAWLYGTIKKRSEYLPVFGQELVAGKIDTVNKKYLEWMLMVENEAKAEGRLSYKESIVEVLKKVQEGKPWFFIKNQLPEDFSTVRITKIVCDDYSAMKRMWWRKSSLQQSLNGHNPKGFVREINELLEYISQKRNYLRAPRHPKVPYLPVFAVTFGIE